MEVENLLHGKKKVFSGKSVTNSNVRNPPGGKLVGWHRLGVPGINSQQLLKIKEDFFFLG